MNIRAHIAPLQGGSCVSFDLFPARGTADRRWRVDRM